jgi:hypothetical protein
LKYSTATVPRKPNDPGTRPIGRGNEKKGEPTMPRCELAATALALIVGACLILPLPAKAEQSDSQSPGQSASQSPGQPASDADTAKPAEAQKRDDRMAAAEAMKVRETDRLMRWLNESALWTGTDERTRARSIRFR